MDKYLKKFFELFSIEEYKDEDYEVNDLDEIVSSRKLFSDIPFSDGFEDDLIE